MDKDKVLDLAKLARIEMAESEAETLSKEFDAILKYVGEVKSIPSIPEEFKKENFALKNVMREDGHPHETGIYTEKILSQAPQREGNYVKVKKIL